MTLKFKWKTEFKETGIGEIPRDWEVRKIGDIIKIKYGKGLPSKNRKEGNVPVFGSSGVVGYHNSFVAKGPGLIIGRKGNIGSVYLSKTNFFPIDTVFYAEEVNDAHFMYYLLSQVNLQQLMSDSAVPGLNINFLKSVFIPYPPPPEQSRIATVLSWFDDLIENKKRQNEILEKVAMAIFKSWFVDFEPFKDEEFVYNEELGKEIPKGWEVDSTTRIIDFNPPLGLKRGKEYPFVEMKHVSTNSAVCDFDYKEFIGSGVKYRGGDTLMARITPSLEHGKTAYVWFISEKENGFGTTEFFVLHPKKVYLKEFTYLFTKSDDFRDVAINSMTGTSGRQRADINALKNFLIPIPPQPILEQFHSLVEPLFQKIILNQKQIMVLRKIRDALLPQLVFGKLRVVEL
ncbi:MAG: restriction endonuclease subunit S [Candidatus Desulfofervidaceae bacterium]|nr:restriction endonuclease subunit S [Candidatus Desulfofervidaceae bacterium]